MKEIKLTKGQITIVDDSDFEWLNQNKWFYSRYAKRAVGPHGKQKQLSMHNIIMQPPPGYEVDHINGNKLDNRRENLRVCTHLENQRNKRASYRSKSGARGVDFTKNGWRAYLGRNFLGYYKTVGQAASAYNRAAQKKYGEFAKLNQL